MSVIIIVLHIQTLPNVNPSQSAVSRHSNLSIHSTHASNISTHHYILNDSERIRYYMGQWHANSVQFTNITWYNFWVNMLNRASNIESFSIFNYSQNYNSIPAAQLNNGVRQIYTIPFLNFLNLSNSDNFMCQNSGDALIVNGDTTNHDKYGDTVPVFAKARVISPNKYANTAILIQELEFSRHWRTACNIMNNDIGWNQKENKVLWRGASSDGWYRRSFVRQYIGNYSGHSDMNHFQDIDVGFTSFDVRSYETIADLKPFWKHPLKIKQLLKYKYLVSIDGNDVASNTKWILMSNSVLFMLPPTKESWLMEGLLLPYVHYVPLSLNITKNDAHTTSFKEETWSWNLEEQYEFCVQNDEICNEIAQNGKTFMLENKFCDREHEQKLEQAMLDIYCQQNHLHFKRAKYSTYGHS